MTEDSRRVYGRCRTCIGLVAYFGESPRKELSMERGMFYADTDGNE